MDNRTVISLFDIKESHSENVQKAFKFISEKYHILEEKKDRLLDKISRVEYRFKEKGKQQYRSKNKFESNCKCWLDSDFDIKECIG